MKTGKRVGVCIRFHLCKEGHVPYQCEMKSDEETEINGMGPDIQPEDVDALFEKLDGLKDGDVLVLSGSIPL